MQQLQNVWSSLDARRRVIALLATVAVFASVFGLTRMASQPSLSLLYSGLESGAAGEVVQALEARGVAYDVRGGAIFVETAKRDELRMTLASEGLPTNGAKGYELLDSLSGFGTTTQMFDAAYWRAKEGELARTIVSSPLIAGARVHIANVGSNPFQRNVRPSASVSITTAQGGISASHAKALKYLVASAVTGLSPDDVSVIDGKGGLIGTGEEPGKGTSSDDKADRLRERVQNLLEARVGYGNAVVELSIETVTESSTIRETLFDPASRVVISTDTEERSNNSTESGGGGDVTVASNLPTGDGAQGDNASSQNSETRERVNYEVSETLREVVRQPGAIKRLTVAVLVNGTASAGEDGAEVFTPRPEEELAALRELVASAVGFDEARGDVITLKSMVFEPIAPSGSEASGGLLANLNLDLMSIIQMAVLALVTLILGLFVLRPLLSRPPAGGLPALAAPSSRGRPGAAAGAPGGLEALTGEIDDGDGDLPGLALVSDSGGLPIPSLGELGGMGGMAGMGGDFGAPEDPAERLRNLIGERQAETMEILRSWLDPSEERA